MTYTRTTETMLRYAGWFFLATAFSSAASAADYYVSPSGNDANNGTSVSSAWRTIAKANGLLRAGDTLYMRGGEYVDDPIVPSTSGRSGSPIVYTAYQTERPVLTSSRVLGLEDAILLRNISYVVVQRVAVDGRAPAPQATVAHFATLDGATYIEIRDCDFKHADGWTGISIYGEAHHNLIVRNRIDFVGRYARDGDDFGDSIWIDTQCAPQPRRFQLSHARRARSVAHEGLQQHRPRQRLRQRLERCLGEGLGARNATIDGTRNVFQRNIVRGTKKSIDSPWNQAMKVEGTGNIARRNLIMDNHHDAFTSEVGSWQRYSRDARIYNNTIYNNGGAAWRIRYYQNETRPSGNEFKNNLVYRNRQTPSNGVGNTNDSDIWMYMVESGADAPADNRVINNLVAKSVAGDGRVYLDPPSLLGPLTDAERQYPNQIRGNIQAVPVFVSSQPRVFRDFELAAGSPGRDAAAALTTTTGTGSGSEITVADASYFNDGYGLGPGDMISVGAERELRVMRVDFAANKLLLSRSIGWADRAPVNLEYAGAAPDIGAVEAGRAAQFSERPQAPRLSGRAAN